MDHIRIIKRSIDITRVYRALWVFGLLLALTTGGGGGGNGASSGSSSSGSGNMPWNGNGNGNWPRNWPDFTFPNLSSDFINTMIGIAIGALCIILLLAVAFTVLRYVSNTALIRMTNQYETIGEKAGVRAGFRLGWSRGAFRSWLVDLLIGLVGAVVSILALLVAAAPLLLWLTQDNTAGAIGTVMAIGLGILVILALIVIGIGVSLMVQFTQRAIILENLGVMDGIRRGWGLLRRHLGDVIIMGLILFAIGIGFTILMIPVFFILLLAGVVVGGLPALLAGGITNIFAQGHTPQIVAAIVGVPILAIVIIAPMLVLGGIFETFKSATWTLTYRELLALEAVRPAPVEIPPAPDMNAPAAE